VAEEVERVTQLWPKELKQAVRGLVGQRGLTDFTLDAVRRELDRRGHRQPSADESLGDPISLTDASVAIGINPEEPLEDDRRPVADEHLGRLGDTVDAGF
jgi:hypothetical protein